MDTQTVISRRLDRRFVAYCYNYFLMFLLYPLSCLLPGLLVLLIGRALGLSSGHIWLVSLALGLAVSVAVMAFYTSKGRQTEAAKSVDLAVVDGQELPLTFGRAFLRALLIFASSLPLGAGMWWAAIDKQGRSWPDMALGTKMIDKSGEEFRLPIMVPVMHGLCLLVISSAVLALFTFFDLFSLPGSVIYYGLSALLAGLLVLYILTSIAISHSNEKMKKLLRSNRKLQILAFISAIIVFVSLLAISSFK